MRAFGLEKDARHVCDEMKGTYDRDWTTNDALGWSLLWDGRVQRDAI